VDDLLTGRRVIAVDPVHPREDRLAIAARTLAAGGIVALPTETFYALAVDAFDPGALDRINRVKGKDADAPVLLLLADPKQTQLVADELPERFHTLAAQFWPGPLTLVVHASARVPREVSGGRGTVAVRVPGLALPRRLAGKLGRPLSGVSANRYREPPCRTALEVSRVLGDDIDLILDGGRTAGGAPSTIVDLTGPRPRVLREGILPAPALRPFVGDLET
jgi:L-threonylcarbamoyladenylate synthase